jgi:hypothetical protein
MTSESRIAAFAPILLLHPVQVHVQRVDRGVGPPDVRDQLSVPAARPPTPIGGPPQPRRRPSPPPSLRRRLAFTGAPTAAPTAAPAFLVASVRHGGDGGLPGPRGACGAWWCPSRDGRRERPARAQVLLTLSRRTNAKGREYLSCWLARHPWSVSRASPTSSGTRRGPVRDPRRRVGSSDLRRPSAEHGWPCCRGWAASFFTRTVRVRPRARAGDDEFPEQYAQARTRTRRLVKVTPREGGHEFRDSTHAGAHEREGGTVTEPGLSGGNDARRARTRRDAAQQRQTVPDPLAELRDDLALVLKVLERRGRRGWGASAPTGRPRVGDGPARGQAGAGGSRVSGVLGRVAAGVAAGRD